MTADSLLNALENIAENYHLRDEYPDKFIEQACQAHICKWLKRCIEKGDDVLELGYGDGYTTEQLKSVGKSYTVVEGSKKLFDKLKLNHPEVNSEFSLFEQFIPSKKFDKVLALHVFEHVNDPNQILEKTKNWMSKNSELIIVVPNSESIHRRLALRMGLIKSTKELSERDKLVGHRRVYDFQSLKRLVLSSGLNIIEENGFFLKAIPNSMMVNFPKNIINALNEISDEMPPSLAANIAVRARLA